MSFSSDIKTELTKIRMADCCSLAECYGMLLFSRSFTENEVSLSVSNLDTAKHFASLMHRCFDCRVVIAEKGKKRKIYKAYIKGEADKIRMLNTYKNGMNCGFDSINHDKLAKECCMSAFLRGAFLAAGSVSNPEKQYRLEFVVKDNNLAVDLYGLLYRKHLNPYMSTRGKSIIVYIKKSEDIEDFLTVIDAPHYSLEMMSAKVVKEIRNTENRRTNYETANIAKAAGAAVTQNEAIKKLKKSGKLVSLSDELKLAAKLRSENPDASLSELVKIINSKGITITRSGLNHRLNKLIELSKE